MATPTGRRADATRAYYRRQNVKQRRSRIPLTDRTVPEFTGGNLDLPAVRVNATLASVTVQRMNDQGGQIDLVVAGVPTTITAARTAVGNINAGDLVNFRLVAGFTGVEEIRFYGVQDNEIARAKINASGEEANLAFLALNHIGQEFVADVIKGTGNLTEARTATIFLLDRDGIWQSYASGVPGKVYANDKWWLYSGPAGTNEVIDSRDFTAAGWSGPSGGTGTEAFDAVGLEGIANTATTLTDTDVAGAPFWIDLVTIPDDSAVHVVRWFIGKDADVSRFPEIQVNLVAGVTQSLSFHINTSTGDTSVIASLGTVAHEVIDRGLWWEVLVSIQNNTSGNVTIQAVIRPAAATVIGTPNVAAIGSAIIGNAEIHLNKTIEQVRGTTPIFTSGATGSVDAADPSFDDANHADLEGAYFCEFKNVGVSGSDAGGLVGLGNAGRIFFTSGSTQILANDGTTNAVGPAITLAADDVEFKLGLAYGDSLQRVNIDGIFGTAVAYDGVYNSSGTLNVLHGQNTSVPPGVVMLLRNLRRYDLSFTDAQTKIAELMA